MADKRITDVDYINSLTGDESFFVNHNNSIKQVNKSNIVFDVTNGGTGAATAADARVNLGLGSVATENTVPVTKGGTGATTAAAALTNLGITATASELNIMDGITATTTELNYCDGVTSNIQSQLNSKADYYHGHDYAASGHSHTASEIGAKVSGAIEAIGTGGTGSSNGATGLKNLFAAGATVLTEGTSHQYGSTLPSAGTKGRIFFKKVSN